MGWGVGYKTGKPRCKVHSSGTRTLGIIDMSLRIKCVHYETAYLSTLHDLEALKEDLKVLIMNGYNVMLDVSATNSMAGDCWGTSSSFSFLPMAGKKHASGEQESFTRYNDDNRPSGMQPKVESLTVL
jgi:hypothetical protein